MKQSTHCGQCIDILPIVARHPLLLHYNLMAKHPYRTKAKSIHQPLYNMRVGVHYGDVHNPGATSLHTSVNDAVWLHVVNLAKFRKALPSETLPITRPVFLLQRSV
jgi:hypothetical protein